MRRALAITFLLLSLATTATAVACFAVAATSERNVGYFFGIVAAAAAPFFAIAAALSVRGRGRPDREAP